MYTTSVILAVCGGFLLAVLWMDLMFDVQVLRHRDAPGELPEPVLASIAGYYRRVTTDARPMGHLVGVVMSATVALLVVQMVGGHEPVWLAPASLLLAGGPIVLAAVRVYPNAVRLGARTDDPLRQSRLARTICRDHLLCLGGIVAFLLLRATALP
jgi:hypothetical protein